MTIASHISIYAPVDAVWRVMSDVLRWPEWTPSITSVELLNADQLRIGAQARIRQPRLPSAVWTVTALEPPRYFEWRAVNPGLTTMAGHRLEPDGDGSRVRLTLEWRGPLAPLIRLLYGGLSRHYVDLEAEGLKRRAEQGKP
jgi:uncharacterized membrane protein